MTNYKPPEYEIDAFNCPHCGAYSRQYWFDLADELGHQGVEYELENVGLAYCYHCGEYSIWYKERMIYPHGGSMPLPHPDLPDEIKDDYEEARSIASLSPRGAAALLRLAIQKLCKEFGGKGKSLNTDIADLVEKGLPPKIQKALDIVRVIGNNAVHPGQIDIKDDSETVGLLLKLINLIIEEMITRPRELNKLYTALPEGQRKAIAERDNVAQNKPLRKQKSNANSQKNSNANIGGKNIKGPNQI